MKLPNSGLVAFQAGNKHTDNMAKVKEKNGKRHGTVEEPVLIWHLLARRLVSEVQAYYCRRDAGLGLRGAGADGPTVCEAVQNGPTNIQEVEALGGRKAETGLPT